jgi:LysR family transcriptional regulator, glycine cleavage system transcriptional activator
MEQPGKLPPLPALRVFEVVARLGSISAAADELFVTHSAVSQQIKSLEDVLGVRLFGRSGRRLSLTAAGQELALGTNEALCALARTTNLVRQRANPHRLTVTTLPSFAARWLTPRIGGFMQLEPRVEINLISTYTNLDLSRDGIDVAIRFGLTEKQGIKAEALLDDEMLVVASPNYLDGKLPKTPADLSRCTLLRSDGEFWQPWFQRAGLDWAEPDTGLFFNDSSLALQWAEDGRGVALTRRSLADDALCKGRVVQLFDIALPMERGYWFVTPEGVEPTPLLTKFREWLFAEAAQTADRLAHAEPPLYPAELCADQARY